MKQAKKKRTKQQQRSYEKMDTETQFFTIRMPVEMHAACVAKAGEVYGRTMAFWAREVLAKAVGYKQGS